MVVMTVVMIVVIVGGQERLRGGELGVDLDTLLGHGSSVVSALSRGRGRRRGRRLMRLLPW